MFFLAGIFRVLCLVGWSAEVVESVNKVEQAGFDPRKFQVIETLIAEAIENRQFPGLVLAVGRKDQLVYLKAFGHRRLQPHREPMTVDTIFDLASLTKPIATATAIMKLVEFGKVSLDASVATYWPEFGVEGKDELTVRDLLLHQGGLIADNPVEDYRGQPDEIFTRIAQLKLVSPPRSRFIYSDVGFLVLGKVVERVSGQSLSAFVEQHVFTPLNMRETQFAPQETLRARAAPTELRDGMWLEGIVHDPRAARLDGCAGHAGLFSTARDLSKFAQMMLNRGQYDHAHVLLPETVELMTTPHRVPGNGIRGLGWDMRSAYSSNRGDLLSSRAYGHGGFTGTVMWIDPELDLFYIILTNRLHPDGKGVVNPLAGRLGTILAAALPSAPRIMHTEPRNSSVKTGIDVLSEQQFAPLRGHTVGLITNHTGRDRMGRSTVQMLLHAEGVKLQTLFSPEHGIEGILDQSKIHDSIDPASGLKIVSLYGEHRSPPAGSLKGLDALVFDIQDIGTRFYTYISTMGLAMQAAAEHGLKFVVLDRPNPLGGLQVEGPLLEAGLESFVGFHTLPVRHGMTVGELAKMFASEKGMPLDLVVIPMEGWSREQYYEDTGLAWINPSPNMRSMTAAFIYPGLGLLETTNLSVGRGTDRPFEWFGAPWLNSRGVSKRLNESALPGVRFMPGQFTPNSSKYAGIPCEAVHIQIIDREVLQPVLMGLTIAEVLLKEHRDEWDASSLMRLLANRQVYTQIMQGARARYIELQLRPELTRFRERRSQFLLYPKHKDQ